MKNLFKFCGFTLMIFLISSCEKKPYNHIVSIPYVRTSIKNITQRSVSFEGIILGDGGDYISSQGVCWGTNENPTVENDSTMYIFPNDVFTGIIYNLIPSTKYYFRTFAQNSIGIGYGNTVSRSTLPTEIGFNTNLSYGTINDIENNKYKTISIGNQTWMAENLRTTKYQNGDLIGTTSSPTQDISGESTPEYQWAYDGNESIAEVYGRLYTWYVINDSRKICPVGWHVPTQEEWTTLTNFLINNGYGLEGSENNIANAMAATNGWEKNGTQGTPGSGQTINNKSGFSALPGGFRSGSDGGFTFIGEGGYWWSSTDVNNVLAWRGCYIWFGFGTVYADPGEKKVGNSVRCLKD
jgi:uncharacterized protein (TIGR02145 family)